MGQVLNSAIALPEQNQEVVQDPSKPMEISGWAHGDGNKGTQVVKVELSFDEGQTWQEAHDYIKEDKEKGKKVFSWTLWKYNYTPNFEKADRFHSVSVMIRATASDGEVQDKTIEEMYNIRGLMNNVPHKVKFFVKA